MRVPAAVTGIGEAIERSFRLAAWPVGLVVLALLHALVSAADESDRLPKPVKVEFSLTVPVELKAEWTLVVTPHGEGLATIRQSISGTQPTTLMLPEGSEWELAGELPGFWVKRQLVTISPGTDLRRVELQLWPLGTLRGTLRGAGKKVSLPETVVVHTLVVPEVVGRPKSPAGSLICPVSEEGQWNCELPAGKMDLTLIAEGFIPHYVWGVEVPPHGVKTLPALELRRGASVAGWVAIEGGKIDPESCIARLVPATNCRATPGQAVRNIASAVEAHVGGDGFVQFTDLAPGHYALEVRQPGYATATAALIEVVARRETFLTEPLVLATPLTLRLEIDPPLDLLDQPWRVQVYSWANSAANGGVPATVFDGSADGEGRLVVNDLSPGEVSVDIDDAEGNRIFDSRTVLGPWKLVTSAIRRIEIPQIRIEGRLTLGEDPVAATLWFGGKSGAQRVRLECDEDGLFAGVLPREGLWRVAVVAEEPRLDTSALVTIRPGRSGEAHVDLELPDTRVFGRVVDRGGRPLAEVTVSAVSDGNTVFNVVGTDALGAFELRGLPAADLSLSVYEDNPSCQTELHLTRLAEGMEVGPIELRCSEMKQVQGTVVSKRGPVAGAVVGLTARPPASGGDKTISGQDGSFSLNIPADLNVATVYWSAESYGAQARVVSLQDSPLRLNLQEEVGEIEVETPFAPEDYLRTRLRIALYSGGIEIPLRLVPTRTYPGAGGVGARVGLSQLAPGDYAACFVPASILPGATPGSERTSCAAGRLEAGGRLTLSPQPPP